MSEHSALPILIIEDNEANRDLTTWILEDENFQVEAAETAELGLEMLNNNSYALVLMDISLPQMDGKQAIQEIRKNEHYGNVPIIALTAHTSVDELAAINAAGADAILNKPVDEEAMVELIKQKLAQQ